MIQEMELDESWIPIIIKYTIEAIRSVWPNVRYNDDNMNINRYLRILKIEHTDTSLCDYVNGIVFFKDIIHKRMQSLIYNPRILMLSGGAEFQS